MGVGEWRWDGPAVPDRAVGMTVAWLVAADPRGSIVLYTAFELEFGLYPCGVAQSSAGHGLSTDASTTAQRQRRSHKTH